MENVVKERLFLYNNNRAACPGSTVIYNSIGLSGSLILVYVFWILFLMSIDMIYSPLSNDKELKDDCWKLSL